MSRGSRQVIMAIPAVRFLIIWWAARRMRDSSESRAKSFRMICSQVVMAILIERSTTGCTSSWTARSTDCRIHCFNWGWAWSREILKEIMGEHKWYEWENNHNNNNIFVYIDTHTHISITECLCIYLKMSKISPSFICAKYLHLHLYWCVEPGLPGHTH